jgi:hypothetical protein
VSNVTKIKFMFNNASSFNQDIGSWDVSNSLDMTAMFQFANSFNQDLTQWCVTSIPNEPRNFSSPGLPFNSGKQTPYGALVLKDRMSRFKPLHRQGLFYALIYLLSRSTLIL